MSNLKSLIARQRAGFTFDRVFYTEPEIFRLDFTHIISAQWLFIDHETSLRHAGDYVLYEVGGESIIVVRDSDGDVRAYFNVCRHRGSRICLKDRGNIGKFVCPYHAWTYDLSGELITAPRMPPDFDRAGYGLRSCPVRIFEGLIFVNPAPADTTPDFEALTSGFGGFLRPHGLPQTKIAHRAAYPIAANWKLVIENFRECYHCAPAHPEYTAVNAYVKSGLKSYRESVSAWEQKARELGHVTGIERPQDARSGQPLVAWRQPIRDGFLTLTNDGSPAGPLLGDFKEYDGGETFVAFSPLYYVYAANDHATLFRITPLDVSRTEIVITWVVREDAREGIDYDVDHVKWMWDVTTRQDVQIINNNQKGVNSIAYTPGPYSQEEAGTADFTAWYLDQMRKVADTQ